MSDDLVTIATYDTPAEAGLDRSLLEAAGIRVFTANEATVGIAWHLGAAVGGIRLRVLGQDAERAVALLEDARNIPPLSAADWPDEIQGEQVPDGDGAEDERDESTRDSIASRALRAAFLGLLLPPLQLYAIWLLGRIAVKTPPMNRSDRRRVAVTAVLCVYVVILSLIILRGIVGRPSYGMPQFFDDEPVEVEREFHL